MHFAGRTSQLSNWNLLTYFPWQFFLLESLFIFLLTCKMLVFWHSLLNFFNLLRIQEWAMLRYSYWVSKLNYCPQGQLKSPMQCKDLSCLHSELRAWLSESSHRRTHCALGGSAATPLYLQLVFVCLRTSEEHWTSLMKGILGFLGWAQSESQCREEEEEEEREGKEGPARAEPGTGDWSGPSKQAEAEPQEKKMEKGSTVWEILETRTSPGSGQLGGCGEATCGQVGLD